MILTESTPLSCLDKCAFSRRCIYRAYISSLFSVLGLWQCRPRGVAVSVADPGCEERGGGGVRGFWGLPPRFFGYILANLGDFLKNLAKIEGGGRLLPRSILDCINLCADRGLEVGLADPLCSSGGGGGASTPNAPPAYGPVSCFICCK